MGASVSTLEGYSRRRLYGNPADLSRVLEDTSPSDVRHGVPSDSLRREPPVRPHPFPQRAPRPCRAGGGRISSQYADPSIGTSPPAPRRRLGHGKASPTMLRATSSTPIRCGREIAAAFGDVLLADSAPSELEFHGRPQWQRASPGGSHRWSTSSPPFQPVRARRELYSHLGTITGSS